MKEPYTQLPGRALRRWSTESEWFCLSGFQTGTSFAPAGDLSKGRFAPIIHFLVLKCCFSPRRLKINSSSSQEDLQQDALPSNEEERQSHLVSSLTTTNQHINLVLRNLNEKGTATHNPLGCNPSGLWNVLCKYKSLLLLFLALSHNKRYLRWGTVSCLWCAMGLKAKGSIISPSWEVH